MKKLMASLTFVLALPALLSNAGAKTANDLPQPIRQAVLKGSVARTSITRLADGTYDYKKEVVCTVSIKIPVYDDRGSDVGFSVPAESLPCLTSIEGKAVELRLGGYMTLSNTSVFEDEANASVKSGSAFLYVKDASIPDAGGVITPISTSSRDLGVKSMIAETPGTSDVDTCEKLPSGQISCKRSTNDFFTSTVEFKD